MRSKRPPAGWHGRAVLVAAAAGALASALLLPTGGVAASATTTAPQPTGQPRILGTPVVGKVLTATNGSWSGSTPMTFSYQWRRCPKDGGAADASNCGVIPDATKSAYRVRAADVDYRLRVRVRATNSSGSAVETSNATDIVKPAPSKPALSSPPTINGTPVQNATLTVNRGTWTGAAPMTFSFQWRRCDQTGGSCSSISGATGKAYTLKEVDVGNTIRVQVTATNGSGSTSSTSAPTAVVQKAAAPSGAAISVNEVSLPNRLIIDRVSFSPSHLRTRRRVIARFRVSDSHQHPVSGALVFVVGVPFGDFQNPPEATTGSDGYVTLALHPTRRYRGNGIVFFVRARKPGEPLLAGVSTRRLVFLPG
jgi:Ig domain of plant-specific actin-binding protein